MPVTRHHIADVVRIGRNGGKFLGSGVVIKQAQHVASDVCTQPDVTETVLCESQRFESKDRYRRMPVNELAENTEVVPPASVLVAAR